MAWPMSKLGTNKVKPMTASERILADQGLECLVKEMDQMEIDKTTIFTSGFSLARNHQWPKYEYH
jgi:hypothetical protein